MSESLPLLPLVLADVPPGLPQALAQEGVPFVRREAGAIAGRFVLFDSRRGSCPALPAGQTPIDVDRLRTRGEQDPFTALVDQRSERRQWQTGGLVVSEEIARVDRRAVRGRLMQSLRDEIEHAGGLWLCVSAYPFPYRSALNFRIDYDDYEAHDFEALVAALAGREDATSHFVSTADFQSQPHALARLRGLDVGGHGHRHHTYRTVQENLDNIRRGLDVLRAQGIEPSGFVAPHGRYHRALAAAMEQLGIGHSSEFGLAYDDVPFYPLGSSVLQIPIHPVSLGIFLETVRGEEAAHAAATRQAVHAATEHFVRTAESKYRAGEPVFLYDHPTGRLGRYPQVLDAVFAAAAGFAAIWRTTLTEFARWWRSREGVRLSVTGAEGQYIVTAEGQPAEFPLAVEYWRGPHVARMPLESGVLRFWPAALAYESRGPATTVRPRRVDRPEGLRGRLRRLIDWEKVTPVDEIRPTNWRNVAKRTLRQIRK